MANKKKIAMTLGAMALTAVVAIGGTLAYLSSVTETKKNTFTSSKDVSTELTETKWTENSGKDYIPGQVIAKNPVMTNDTDSNTEIYVAVKLDYLDNDQKLVSYDTFKKYAEVQTTFTDNNKDGFTDSWEKIKTNADGSEIWIVRTKLAKGASTDAIFESVKVNAGITEVWTESAKTTETYKVDGNGNKTLVNTETETYDPTYTYVNEKGEKVDAATLPSFEIQVTGFAIQAEGFTVENGNTITNEGINELVKLVNTKSNTKFN